MFKYWQCSEEGQNRWGIITSPVGRGLIEHRANHTVAARIPHAFPGRDGLRHLKRLALA